MQSEICDKIFLFSSQYIICSLLNLYKDLFLKFSQNKLGFLKETRVFTHIIKIKNSCAEMCVFVANKYLTLDSWNVQFTNLYFTWIVRGKHRSTSIFVLKKVSADVNPQCWNFKSNLWNSYSMSFYPDLLQRVCSFQHAS